MSDTNAFMVAMGERVRRRRIELGLTQDELSQKMGYQHKTSISRIEKGLNEIPQSKMQAFADALQTTIGYLMGWTEDIDKRIGLTIEERQIIAYYRSLNRVGKDVIYKTLEGLATSGAYREDTSASRIG